MPAISLGVDYNTLLGLTPISYNVVMKGLMKRRELALKEQDELNFLLSLYILSGVAGKKIDKPLLQEWSFERSEKEILESKKEKFINIANKINEQFNRKEN